MALAQKPAPKPAAKMAVVPKLAPIIILAPKLAAVMALASKWHHGAKVADPAAVRN